MRRKIIKIGTILLATILLLPWLLFGFLQTGLSRRLMIDLVEKHSPRFINGTIHMSDISGSFLGDLAIHDLTLEQAGDTILHVGEMAAFFRVAPLFRGDVVVDSFRIHEGYLHLVNDSVLGLNVTRLVPPSDEVEESPGSGSFNLRIGQLIVDPLRIKLTGFNPPVPTLVQNITIRSSLEMAEGDLLFSLDSLSAKPNQPWPELRLLSFVFRQSAQSFSLSNLRLRTLRNEFLAQGSYTSDSCFDGRLNLHKPSVGEFEFMFPDITVADVDTFFLKVDNRSGQMLFDAGIEKGRQRIALQGDVVDFHRLFSDSLAVTPFKVMLTLQNVRPNEWMPALPEGMLLTGSMEAEGERLALASQPIRFSADFKGSAFGGIKPDRLFIRGVIASEMATTTMDVAWQGQAIKGNLRIRDWQMLPRFDGLLQFEGWDAALWPGAYPMRFGDGNIRFQGQGNDLESLQAQGDLMLRHIEAYGLPADSLLLKGRFDGGVANIDTLLFAIADNSVSASGHYNLKKELVHGDLVVDLNHFKLDHPLVPMAVGVGKGRLATAVDGKLLQPHVIAQLDLNNLMVDSISVEKVVANLDGVWLPKQPMAALGMRIENLLYGDYKANAIEVKGSYHDGMAAMDLQALLADSIHFDLTSQVWPGDTTTVQLPHFSLGTGQIGVEAADTLKFRFSGLTLWVDRFELTHRQRPESRLWAKGTINPLGLSDFQLALDQFHSEAIQPMVAFDLPKATGSMKLHLTGEPNSHRLDVETQIDSLIYNQLLVHRIIQKGSLTNRGMNLETRILNQAGEHLSVFLKSDHWFRQDSLHFEMVTQPTLALESQVDDLPLLKIVPPAKDYQVSGGLLSFRLLVTGKLTDPFVDGFIRVSDAAFRVPAAGIDFTGFNMGIKASGSSMMLDSLNVRSGKGSLSMLGDMAFESGVLSPVKDFNLSLLADGFRLRRRNFFDLTFDAKASVKTGQQESVFDGRIDVVHAQLNMDKLMAQSGPKEFGQDALLVTALAALKEPLIEAVEEEAVATQVASPFDFGVFKGRLKLVIPRNTWLKGDNMGIELMGDLDVVKEGADFELFGSVGVNRGFYNLYGRKLNIVKGDLLFQGGTTIDPALNLQAQYVFRTSDRQKKTLEATVGGKLSQPEIDFELNGESVSQGDAIGYLVFGKPMSELGVSSQQAVGQSSAGDAVSGLLTSELTKLLGNKLNLDVFEIDASDNWESASFVVGKYITNNLFVIYQRAFGKASDNDIAPETVTLEYEINRHLFFRLESGDEKSSGVDLIFKVESKNK